MQLASDGASGQGVSKRGFWPLIVTQFQGAFNENAYKYLVTFLIIGMALPPARRDLLVLLVTILFAVPWLLFSMTGGFLADRFSKRSVTVGTKVFELGVSMTAMAGLAWHSLPLQLAAVFLLSTQGALFSASKYGLLPELLPEKRLSWGNGVLEFGTFLAIITGMQAGILLSGIGAFHGRQYYSGLILLALTVCGLLASLGISRVPAADPSRRFRANFVADLISEIRWIRTDRVLWLAVLGNTYFWFFGALLQFNMLFLGEDVLHLSKSGTALLLGTLLLGIGLGSMLAGYLSSGKIEYGFVPLGAIGMTVFCSSLSYGHLSVRELSALFICLGFFSGFAVVPISALIQHRPAGDRKGAVLGAAGLLSWVGIILGPAVVYALKAAGWEPPRIFLVAGLMTAVATIYAVKLLPDSLIRLVLWFFTHSVYRIRVAGRDNIPDKGGALFVCNHMSFVDALLLIASTDRFIRFVMFKDIYEHPVIKPFAKTLRAIPISSQLRPREMIRSLREASQAIRDGEVVCIFAEGQITRIGQMLPFRRGLTRIIKGLDAPIIPVHLEGVWGSIFSFEKGRFFWKLPRRIPYPVTVTYGTPMPPASTPLEVREAVQALGTEAFAMRRRRMRPLGRAFVRTARRYPLRFAFADTNTPRVCFGAALGRAIYLARRLRKTWEGQTMVGILLPPSVGGALTNLAALLMGKVPVNLNYTASRESMASAVEQCGLKTVISSKAFLDRVPIEVPCRMVLLEEVAARPRFSEKLAAFLIAWGLPPSLLQKAAGLRRQPALDDTATIIFSSGSTGDPKGVMLSHYNVTANILQLGQVFMLDRRDRMLGILPFFHSFGFTGALCLPAVLGVGAVYHANPLDARTVGELAERHAVTLMLATPTFLQAYTRRCVPENFGSVKFVLAGAEKLPERVAIAFEDQFGVRPLEGYGCTECAPAIAVNTRDFRAAGFRQVGAKRGTIGHPLPGVSVKIVHVETGERLPPGEAGLLLVKGPNIMTGYLNRPEKTAEVLRDGWYNTGDLAALDEDGFLTIRDRLSRFSKIAGEMVPHLKVEETLHELAGVAEQTFAVTGIPDDRKGERLAVLHTLPEEKLQETLANLAGADLPPLWRPRPNQFFRVERLPYLGTGKLDLRKVKQWAGELSARSAASAP